MTSLYNMDDGGKNIQKKSSSSDNNNEKKTSPGFKIWKMKIIAHFHHLHISNTQTKYKWDHKSQSIEICLFV